MYEKKKHFTMDNVWKKLVVITGNVKGKVFPLQA
jgi:tellurite resistance-related uncharacterized protein